MHPYDIFLKGLAAAPDEDAFINPDGERFGYRAVAARAERLAAALQALGGGSLHCAVYSPNDARAFIALLSIFRAGGRWIPVNVRNSVETNAAFLEKTGCDVLIFHSSLLAEAGRLRELSPGVRHFVCLDAATEDCRSLDDLVADLPPDAVATAPDDRPDTVNLMLATGGTTGASKACLWTGATWESFAASFWMHMPTRTRPVYLVAAPMTHAAGILALPLMLAGSTTVILDAVDPIAIPSAIEDNGVTHLFLPPTAIYGLLDRPGISDHDYSSLEYFIYSASPMSTSRLRQAWEVFGPVMTQGYGLAEAPLLCTFMSPEDHEDAIMAGQLERLESSGRPSMLMRVRTVDEAGRDVPPGELGEIVLRGGLVSPAYHGDEKVTADAKRAGWHHTGDIGRFDADGFLYIVDRKKDMIISGGFNVYSSEVEQVVMRHPGVANCAVIGIPDERWGEAVTAVVQRRADAKVDAGDLIAFCRAALGGVKTPKTVIFRDDLPMSPAGKVLKRVLREEFWHDRERRV